MLAPAPMFAAACGTPSSTGVVAIIARFGVVAVLASNARIQAEQFRGMGETDLHNDTMGHLVGDEFLLNLELPFDDAEPILCRAHAAVTSRPVTALGKILDVSVSLDDALTRADSALYVAKRAGRNHLTSQP